jgi:hypothetical protein
MEPLGEPPPYHKGPSFLMHTITLERTAPDNGLAQNHCSLLVLLEFLHLIGRYRTIRRCQKRTRDSGIQLYNKWKFWI